MDAVPGEPWDRTATSSEQIAATSDVDLTPSPGSSATQATEDSRTGEPATAVKIDARADEPAQTATAGALPGETPARPADPIVPPPAPARPVGQLLISSDPQSTVSLDGRLVGITPLSLEVVPGRHDVTLTTPDGLRWRGRIDVVTGRSSTVHRNLSAVGSLSVVSDVWAEVSVDGGPAEQTPIHFSRIAAGLHELRAFREGYLPQRLEVLVEEGQTTYLRISMEKRP
jgi:hypothetical protein